MKCEKCSGRGEIWVIDGNPDYAIPELIICEKCEGSGEMIEKEVIITGYSNVTSEGIVLHTNIPAKLKGCNVEGTSVWVSWDKIGEALFQEYTQRSEVQDMRQLRKEI